MKSIITAMAISMLGTCLLATVLSGIPLFLSAFCWGFISVELADKITN